MKRAITIACVVALLGAAPAMAATAVGSGGAPGSDPKATGGPDSYGYRFVDNNGDSATYRWIDTTSGVWTTTTNLGDDNAVGPFNIGFSFPYYWYRVTQFWIHANGGISFSLPARAWTPQNSGDNGFPNVNLPNDLIGAVGLDLDFTNAGRCRYRARTTPPESLIVSWLGVYYWNTTNPYTFQLILAKADSSIRVQILSTANPPNNTGSLGIENCGGNVGLSYYNNGTPNGNRLLNGTMNRAIKYYPPATSTYTVTDAGVVAVMNPFSGAVVKHTADAFQPTAILKNFGTTNLTSLKAVCRIRNSANAVVYADSLMNQSIAKGQQLALTFTTPYNPGTVGTFKMVVRNYATGDTTTRNDSIVVELPVVTYPSWVSYDDGARDGWITWSGTSAASPTGFGNYFDLSRYPVGIDSVQAYINTTAGTLRITLYDTTGNMGGPGVVIFDTTITPITVNGWFKLGLINKNLTVNNGKFYVGLRTPTAALQYGMDYTAPLSRRTWEYTGSWTPYRSMETQDAMIQVKCHSAVLAACYVDSAAGNDANAGSSAAPFRTIGRAMTALASSITDTVYIRNGTYNEAVSILPAHAGTAAKRHVIAAQSGQAPRVKANGAAATLADSGASYVTLRGLTVYPGTQQMTTVFQGASNDSFCNNTAYAPTMGPAILLMNQTASVVRGNKALPISDNAYPADGLWLWYSSNNMVDSNQVTGMIDAGILINYSGGVTVRRNVVDHCGLGVSFDNAGADSLYNNTIDNNTNSGVYTFNGTGALTARNNSITNNGQYGFCWNGAGAVSSDYNDVWNNLSNYTNGTHTVAAGTHDRSANPLYTGAYHLQAGSPCINAGTPVGLPYLGVAPDIGAYEDWAKTDLDAGRATIDGPVAFALGIGHPNPFSDRTVIEYSCPGDGASDAVATSLKVYNIAGQLVRTLVDQRLRPGRHVVSWDGRDQQGIAASSGIYYCRLVTGGRQQTRSLNLVR